MGKLELTRMPAAATVAPNIMAVSVSDSKYPSPIKMVGPKLATPAITAYTFAGKRRAVRVNKAGEERTHGKKAIETSYHPIGGGTRDE